MYLSILKSSAIIYSHIHHSSPIATRCYYNALLLSGKLNGYLADIDQQAQEMEETLIQKTAERHGISESLKATDQMAWNRIKG